MSELQPIIVKKKIVVAGGHHGGAWKVAYADFVTAMMAFFLLMWLLNATTEDQRKGLADYFDPTIPVSRVSNAGGGLLDGETIFSEEKIAGSAKEGIRPRPSHKKEGRELGRRDASPDRPEGSTAKTKSHLDAWQQGNAEKTDAPDDPMSDPEAQALLAERMNKALAGDESVLENPGDAGDKTREQAQKPGEADQADAMKAQQQDKALDNLGNEVKEKISKAGGDSLLDHFSFRTTPEGLVIELADITGEPLFQSGAAEPSAVLKHLMAIVVPVLNQTKNQIALVGHTDAEPFGANASYTNWELSADRANASRRMLEAEGLSAKRIVRVSGMAATDPIDTNPLSPKNRRIAITLLRGNPTMTP